MHGRVSYKTVAISLLYLYSKSCVAIMQHRRATAASMLQNGISRNTKWDNMVGFPKSDHKCDLKHLKFYRLIATYYYHTTTMYDDI